jgi:pimeloyl-ACP methyl ester carboxylesterase
MARAHLAEASLHTAEVTVRTPGATLAGSLTVPANAVGMVAFAHGSGSSRLSPRNRAVAAFLNDARLGTLLLDLLTVRESRIDDVTAQLRFDIPLLSARLVGAIDSLQSNKATAHLPLGLFGASTGAAAALCAAAERPQGVTAVVSRGGRPDLADGALPAVRAPTLLIVGGDDETVIDLNREAAAHLTCEWRLEIIPGATHLFEEPGAMEQVALLTRQWFVRHLSG